MKKRGQLTQGQIIAIVIVMTALVIFILAYSILTTKGIGLLDKIKNFFIFWK